jgi:hypothetical protein
MSQVPSSHCPLCVASIPTTDEADTTLRKFITHEFRRTDVSWVCPNSGVLVTEAKTIDDETP